MAAVDSLGDVSGGITHYWPALQSETIEDRFALSPARSGKALGIDLDFLGAQSAEIRAALVAYEIYEGFAPEFQTAAYRIAGMNARDIATRFDWSCELPPSKDVKDKWLVDYIGANEDLVKRLQELAWLRHAFESGVTGADLLDWGVSLFTVIQLTWWERRPGETRLSQHIRAIRNGWGLRYLEQSVRDTYRNLLLFIDKGDAPTEFLEKFATDLAEVRELQAFFSPNAITLSARRQAEWAKAFLDAGILKIAPDAIGQFAHFLPASFKQGLLRKPLEPIARYLESVGVEPKDWADFDSAFFGRN